MEAEQLPSSSPSVADALMAALLSLPSPSFSALTRSLSADLRLHRTRLTLLLLSPPHFSRALSRLLLLPLPHKALLLARLLLRSLRLLLPSLASPPSPLRLPDLDAALLLLAMCDSYNPSAPSSSWHARVASHALASALSPAGLGSSPWAVVGPYVDSAAKCRRFLEAVSGGGGLGKAGCMAGAAAATVVALPSVESPGGAGWECVVCREEMAEGWDVCELPCRHRFHWGCALGWLRRRNTCPCCRFELPTDDVLGEMRRLWRAVVSMGGGGAV